MPGTVHFHLEKLGKIPDPFHGRNELEVQWVDEQDWELRRSVSATSDDCRRTRQELVFDGLDTVATISLNGRVVGRSVNMFRRLVCDVRGVLAPGSNESPRALEEPDGVRRSSGEARSRSLGEEHRFRVADRREAPHVPRMDPQDPVPFRLGLGVYLATSGVWQPARLVCSDAPRIESVKTKQTHRGSSVELEVTVHVVSPVATRGTLSASCASSSGSVSTRLRAGENRVVRSVRRRGSRILVAGGGGESAPLRSRGHVPRRQRRERNRAPSHRVSHARARDASRRARLGVVLLPRQRA